jgi:hypothetical protein
MGICWRNAENHCFCGLNKSGWTRTHVLSDDWEHSHRGQVALQIRSKSHASVEERSHVGPKASKSGIKHGLYAKRISKDEAALMALNAIGDVDGEIALQRALISRLAEILEHTGLAPGSTRLPSRESRETAKLLGQLMRDLLRFLRSHYLRNDESHLYQSQIESGKRLARKRIHVFDYLQAPPSEG